MVKDKYISIRVTEVQKEKYERFLQKINSTYSEFIVKSFNKNIHRGFVMKGDEIKKDLMGKEIVINGQKGKLVEVEYGPFLSDIISLSLVLVSRGKVIIEVWGICSILTIRDRKFELHDYVIPTGE